MSRIVIVICSKMDCVVSCCMVNERELKAIRQRVLAVNMETLLMVDTGMKLCVSNEMYASFCAQPLFLCRNSNMKACPVCSSCSYLFLIYVCLA
jgi:hypothetical protein